MKRPVRELAHELLVDRRLELEVELLERLHRREVRDLDAHRDALASAWRRSPRRGRRRGSRGRSAPFARPRDRSASSRSATEPRRSRARRSSTRARTSSLTRHLRSTRGVVVEAAPERRERRRSSRRGLGRRDARALEVRRVDDARDAARATRRCVATTLGAVEDHDLVVADEHLDGRAHEPVRNAVANRVDVDEAVVARRGGADAAAAPAAAAPAAAAAPRARRARSDRAAARASCRARAGRRRSSTSRGAPRARRRLRSCAPGERVALHVARRRTPSCPSCVLDTAGTRAARRPSRGRTRGTPGGTCTTPVARSRPSDERLERCRRAPSA